jgi:trehalose synthase
MREVEIQPVPLDRLAGLLSPDRAALLAGVAEHARRLLAGRVVWNVNATAQGGGVAEMLQVLLAYGRGAGVDTRWLVLTADADFFAITKRVHNLLHGSPGDGGELGAAEESHYRAVLERNLAMIRHRVRPGDVVLLHDPQTAGLVAGLREAGAHVIWRCHVGRETTDERTDRGWGFLRAFLAAADAFIFSRRDYVPDWVPAERVMVIPPSIDPFSTKNIDLDEAHVRAALGRAGLVAVADHSALDFVRRDGSPGRVRSHSGLLLGRGVVPGDARLVVQVSRWDRLKDMAGVLRGFVEHLADLPPDAHLALVGPDAVGVSDDPEGAEVYAECADAWRRLGATTRDRIHLVCVPMDDVDENAHLVNALQHHASVVVQKSLVEGFGLTVTEAMWKARPVVASAVGGIRDQIDDGVHGVLLPDPGDLGAMAAGIDGLLRDRARAERMGEAARTRVQDRFLGDRHLIQYVDLFGDLAG